MVFIGKTFQIGEEPANPVQTVDTLPKSGFIGKTFSIEEKPLATVIKPPVAEIAPKLSTLESAVKSLKLDIETVKAFPHALDETLGITKAIKEKGIKNSIIDGLYSFGEAIATAAFRTAKSIIGIVSPEAAEKLIPETVPHPTELLLRALGKESWIKSVRTVQIGNSAQVQYQKCIDSGQSGAICGMIVGSGVIFDATIVGGLAEGILRGVAKAPAVTPIKVSEAEKILKVEKGASPEEIKTAYFEKAHETHPDKIGGSVVEFEKVNKAYQTLTGIKPVTLSVRDLAYQLTKERSYPWQKAKMPSEAVVVPQAPAKAPGAITAPAETKPPVVPEAIVPKVSPEITQYENHMKTLTPQPKIAAIPAVLAEKVIIPPPEVPKPPTAAAIVTPPPKIEVPKVPGEEKPTLELKGQPEKEQAYTNISTLESKLKSSYLPKRTKVSEELSNIFMEMETSEAGKRYPIRNEEGTITEWVGQDSTFPKWIPEDLRSRDLFNKVMEGISDIKNIKFPDGNSPNQRALYNAILEELDSRLGLDTRAIRDSILENYDAISKKEAPGPVSESLARAERARKEEINVEEIDFGGKEPEVKPPEVKPVEEKTEIPITGTIDKNTGEVKFFKKEEPPAPKPKIEEVMKIGAEKKAEAVRTQESDNDLLLRREELLEKENDGTATEAEEDEFDKVNAELEKRGLLKVPEDEEIVLKETAEMEEMGKDEPFGEEGIEAKDIFKAIEGEGEVKYKLTSFEGKTTPRFLEPIAEELKRGVISGRIKSAEEFDKSLRSSRVLSDEELPGAIQTAKGNYDRAKATGDFAEITRTRERLEQEIEDWNHKEALKVYASHIYLSGSTTRGIVMAHGQGYVAGGGKTITADTILRGPFLLEAKRYAGVLYKPKVLNKSIDEITEQDVPRMMKVLETQIKEVPEKWHGKETRQSELYKLQEQLAMLKQLRNELTFNPKEFYNRFVGGESKYQLTPYGEDLAKTQAFKEYMAENEMAYGKQITNEEAVAIISKYFSPNEVSINFTKNIIRAGHGLAIAAYSGVNDMISFLGPGTYARVPEHEVVHAYIDLFSTQAERLDVLKDVIRKNPEIKTLHDAEEWVADAFPEYVKYRKGFAGKILAFFSKLLSRMMRFFGKNRRARIMDLFDDIIKRKRPAEEIKIRGEPAREAIKYKEVGITNEELDAYDYIQKGLPVPEELKSAIESLKQKGLINESYVSPEKPLNLKRGQRITGTIRPGQITKIEQAVEEKLVPKQIYAMLRNGFTGVKRTRIGELSTDQADELFRIIIGLTPEEAGRMGGPGKIKLVDKETLAAMRDFIPPSVLSKKYITTGDIFQNIKEKEINYIISLGRPIRKVLTSGELQPNLRSITESIYDTVSLAEEDMRIDYKQFHDDYVKLYRAARKKDKQVDLNVFSYIEQGLEVPPATKALADFLKTDLFSISLPVMKPRRIRQGYITHTAPTFWEKVKIIGMKETLKEVVEPIITPRENIDPGILQALDYIVSKEKFNPFALRRSKYSVYTKQLRKSVQAYASLYFYKKNFDPVMPKILKQKRFLPGSTQKYVTKYLQTVGGRPLDWGLWRGPMGRTIKKSINTGVRFEYGLLLGVNPASALGNVAGGNWNNIADIPPQLLALGHKRLASKQGLKILEKYHLTEQTLWLEPVGGIAEKASKGERGLFALMQGGELWLRGSAALARVPENEFQSGTLSSGTRAIIRRQLGRSQGLFGPAQSPLLSQTTLLRPIWMFKHWMINEIELWHNFAKEYIERYKRNPSWGGRTIKNAGFRRIVKYLIIGALFYFSGISFLKKEAFQKVGIPKTLIGALIQVTNAPLYEDGYFAMQLLVRAGNGEFREAQEDFINWILKKPLLAKSRTLIQGLFEGATKQPSGTLKSNITKFEAFKRLMLGSWTEQGQKENKLNEELSKLLPAQTYTKWDQDLGSRLVKTDYQKNKEDIMNYIKDKGYNSIEELNADAVLVKKITAYNTQATERLRKFFQERDKLTGIVTLQKEWESTLKKVTVQPADVNNWFETERQLRTVPSILRRTR